jgi:hypothetical protein
MQGSLDMQYRQNSNITTTQFNRADVGACQTHACGKSSLGEPTLLPDLANRCAQELQSLVRARSPFSHGVPVEEST